MRLVESFSKTSEKPLPFLDFQPPNLPQFSLMEALKHGVLWPILYSPYDGQVVRHEAREKNE
ncbi:spore coat associated protein CotJA [Effusibacillus consociatus]|uniref:Spore coat associated protein CotJA n=1 Tax=Effusibacillus consociatus TaxID=1117041 RepID=A0ABV9Q7L5_9BACL